jgi:hypothetical protein
MLPANKCSEGRNKLCRNRHNNQSESICAKKIESKRLNARGSTLYIIVEAPEPDARREKLAKRYKNAEMLQKNEKSNAWSALKLEKLLHSRQRKLRLVDVSCAFFTL